MDCLPPELLKIIIGSFSLVELSSVALVCKNWKKVLYKTFDFRWKTLQLTEDQAYASNKILLHTIKGEHNYEELELSFPPISWNESDFLLVHKTLPSLKHLKIKVTKER